MRIKTKHRDKKLSTLALSLLLMILMIGCAGCSNDNSSSAGYNHTEKEAQLMEVINGTSDFYNLDEVDVIEGGKLNNSYFNDKTVYMQVETSMFRFELDEDGNITGHVKYNLED